MRTKGNDRLNPVIQFAEQEGIPYRCIDCNELEKILDKYNYDILVTLGWPYLLDRRVLEKSKYAINVHPTLLPKYRGYRSGPFILLNDEKESGVTVHLLTERLDAGDIISQVSFPVSIFDTPKSMKRKTDEIEGMALVDAINKIQKNCCEFIPQDESLASQYDEIRTPNDSIIDWDRPLKELYSAIRACDDEKYPAFFYVEGQKVCIKLWRPNRPENESDMI